MNTPSHDLDQVRSAPKSPIQRQFNDLAIRVGAELEEKRTALTRSRVKGALAELKSDQGAVDDDQMHVSLLDKTSLGTVSQQLGELELELKHISDLRNGTDADRQAWMDKYINNRIATVTADLAKGKFHSPRLTFPLAVAAFVNPNYLPAGEASKPLALLGRELEKATHLNTVIEQAKRDGLIPADMEIPAARAAFMENYSNVAAIHLE